MTRLLAITAAVLVCVPAAAFADPPEETGFGTYTARLAGGTDKLVGSVVTGNGKVIKLGAGKGTAYTAKQK